MSTLDRCLLLGSCALTTSMAAWLLVAPQNFYATIPGVAASGPMNAHLLRDVGIAYAVLALGLGLALEGPSRARFATAAAALYLCSHAALHVVMELADRNIEFALAEAPGVYLPAILATSIALRFRRIDQRSIEKNAQHTRSREALVSGYNDLEAQT